MIFTNYLQVGYLSKKGNSITEELLDKFEYYFSKSDGSFFKFTEPCDHRLYRAGDSWCEVLGVSAKTFRKYLKMICSSFQSKEAFLEQADPFQGKPYAAYFDRLKKITFFFKNPAFLKDKKALFASIKEGTNDLFSTHISRSDSRPLSRSNINTNNTNKKEHPSKSSFTPTKEGRTEDVESSLIEKKKDIDETAIKMHQIWLEETKGRVKTPPLTQGFTKKLLEALKLFFKENLEKWRRFCKRCASSKWLMGETKSGFKPWLVWMIHKDRVEKIQEGQYGVDETISLDIAPDAASVEQQILEGQGSDEEKNIRLKILQTVGAGAYRAWFSTTEVQVLSNGILIQVGSAFMRDQIEMRFLEALQKGLGKEGFCRMCECML